MEHLFLDLPSEIVVKIFSYFEQRYGFNLLCAYLPTNLSHKSDQSERYAILRETISLFKKEYQQSLSYSDMWSFNKEIDLSPYSSYWIWKGNWSDLIKQVSNPDNCINLELLKYIRIDLNQIENYSDKFILCNLHKLSAVTHLSLLNLSANNIKLFNNLSEKVKHLRIESFTNKSINLVIVNEIFTNLIDVFLHGQYTANKDFVNSIKELKKKNNDLSKIYLVDKDHAHLNKNTEKRLIANYNNYFDLLEFCDKQEIKLKLDDSIAVILARHAYKSLKNNGSAVLWYKSAIHQNTIMPEYILFMLKRTDLSYKEILGLIQNEEYMLYKDSLPKKETELFDLVIKENTETIIDDLNKKLNDELQEESKYKDELDNRKYIPKEKSIAIRRALAWMYLQSRNTDTAIGLLLENSKLEDYKSNRMLASIYTIKKDEANAIAYSKKCFEVDPNDHKILFLLGKLHTKSGSSNDEKYKRGINYLEEASRLGNYLAQDLLGHLKLKKWKEEVKKDPSYKDSTDGKTEIKQVKTLFRQSADAGNISAHCNLGWWYFENKKDKPHKAIEFTTIAAESNFKRAKDNLGFFNSAKSKNINSYKFRSSRAKVNTHGNTQNTTPDNDVGMTNFNVNQRFRNN